MTELVINNWQKGIGESPYAGFAQMFNADIYSKPGALKMSNYLTADSNSPSIVDELIIWAAQDPRTGDVYFTDRVGKVYKRDAGLSTWSVIVGHGVAGAQGNGLVVWKDYLLYARTTKLDAYGPLSGVPGWINDWQNLEAYRTHPMISSSQRFVAYIGDSHYISTLEQNAGQIFDPTNAATYTFNSLDLELASEYGVTCLEEAGLNIAIGTEVGGGVLNIADIFFWDGFSDFISGSSTVRLVEDGVKQMINVNNTLVAIAGTGVPRVSQAITAQSKEIKRFNNMSVPFASSTFLIPAGTDYKEGEILFGIGGIAAKPLGVYALRNNAYVLRYLISSGNFGDGPTDTINIGIVKVIDRDRFLVSWRDADYSRRYGVDIITPYFHNPANPAQYQTIVESEIYNVGTDDDPVTYERCELVLGKALKAGDAVKVMARRDLNDTWTRVAEYNTNADSAFIGRTVMDQAVKNMGLFKDIQVQVLLDVDPLATESLEVMSVRLQ